MIMAEIEKIELTDQQKKAQRARSIAIALVLAGLVALFYVATLLKFGRAFFERSL